MSGSTPSGLGIIAFLFVAVLVFLGLEYIGVILTLVEDSSRTLIWRIVFGLLTPVVILLGLLASNRTGNKTINIVVVLGLVIMNLIYLLLPWTTHLSTLVYSGESEILGILLLGFVSVLTSSFIVLSVVVILFLVLKELS
jgi:TRAP-type C4-dicarboxylate transport system permease large subunit